MFLNKMNDAKLQKSRLMQVKSFLIVTGYPTG